MAADNIAADRMAWGQNSLRTEWLEDKIAWGQNSLSLNFFVRLKVFMSDQGYVIQCRAFLTNFPSKWSISLEDLSTLTNFVGWTIWYLLFTWKYRILLPTHTVLAINKKDHHGCNEFEFALIWRKNLANSQNSVLLWFRSKKFRQIIFLLKKMFSLANISVFFVKTNKPYDVLQCIVKVTEWILQPVFSQNFRQINVLLKIFSVKCMAA